MPAELVEGEFLRTDPSRVPMDGVFCAAIRPHGRALELLP
jgi:hypothetical protein